MATVTNLADFVCNNTGIATTGSDRAKVLVALNDAYQMAVERSACYGGSASLALTGGTSDYATSALASDILAMRSMVTGGSGSSLARLRQITPEDMAHLRLAQAGSGTPTYYAFNGPNQLMLWPTPGSGQTLTAYYIKKPPTLVESAPGTGQESTPSAFPDPYHYDVIGNLATGLIFDYQKRNQGAGGYWRSLAESALLRLTQWVNEFGGTGADYVDIADHFGFVGKGRDLY